MSTATESNSPARGPVLTAGIALAAMAVLSPIGLLVGLPEGCFGLAALTVLIVAALDVVVACALLPVMARGGGLLARCAAGARLAYAAGFAVAAGFLVAPVDVARFHAIWDAALLLFGVHLALAAVALWRGGVVPPWIAALVGVAGLGYIADAVLIVLGTHPTVSVGAFTFIGELVLTLWLISRGIRPARRRGLVW